MSGLDFFVAGDPVAQGSMKGFVLPGKNGGKPRAVVTHSKKGTKPWRHAVATAALAAMHERGFVMSDREPLSATIYYALRRPDGHYNAKGKLKPASPIAPVVPPDLDKLERGIFDALTGVVCADDARIVSVRHAKVYAPRGMPPGVRIQVWRVLESDSWRAYPDHMKPPEGEQ